MMKRKTNAERKRIAARKEKAWRQKLKLYIGEIFPVSDHVYAATNEFIMTNRLLNQYFDKRSDFDSIDIHGFEQVYGKVSDKSDYLLFRMREAVKRFTYSQEYFREVSIARIDSRPKACYSTDLFLLIRDVFVTDDYIIEHLEKGINEDEDMTELKRRLGAFEFENEALWDQLLAWLERYIFPMFDHAPLRNEQLRNLVARRKLAGKYIEKLYISYFTHIPLCLAVNYDLGENLDENDENADTARQPRKRTRSALLAVENPEKDSSAISTTAKADPEEHQGLIDKESDCCICYNRLPDETGIVLYCGHLYCDTCVEIIGPAFEADCPYKCEKM